MSVDTYLDFLRDKIDLEQVGAPTLFDFLETEEEATA